jgi:two-component system copper resistance phosphate regulon response regulator CusR
MKLLIIEDAPRLRTMLTQSLTRLGHAVDVAEDGIEGEMMARSNFYEAIVLDRMLPGKEGLDVLRDLRRDHIKTPVLLLTALDAIEEKVRGFGTGADDYLTKPFALAELIARLEALVRRQHGKADSLLHIGPLTLDTSAKSVTLQQRPITLTAREFSLLECLARRQGQVLSRAQIEAHLYAESDSPLSNAVDAAVYSLRRKLALPDGQALLQTRRGLGYVLEAP